MTETYRKVGPFNVSPIGLGCMNVSHAYGPAIEHAAVNKLLNHALDLGCNFIDTASLYGQGANETLIGETLRHRRSDYILASKCVLGFEGGKRILDGRPKTIKSFCEASLKRLQTDVIDLYYLHRLDRNVPVEDSVGALSELVSEGKIRAIGLSEMSAATLRRAHAVHPVAAMQTEYSLWTRNAEISVLDACADLGVSFVAFSPLARGFLANTPVNPATFQERDIRRAMPRFSNDHYPHNLELLGVAKQCAADVGCTVSQLALAWVMSYGAHVVPIPGTTKIEHLESNLAAAKIKLPQSILDNLNAHFAPKAISGPRYPTDAQIDIDTEQFTFETAG